MRLSNRAIGFILAGAMLSLLVTTMLIRKFGNYPMLTEPASSPSTNKPPPTSYLDTSTGADHC